MPRCPICTKPLAIVRQREGVYYSCAVCSGRALTIPQVRHVLGDRLAARLLRWIGASRGGPSHACPFCEKAMLTVNIPEPPLELEACRPCGVVWFDLPTYELLPELTLETSNTMAMQATEIIALNRLKEMKEREEAERKSAKKKKKGLRRAGDDGSI